MKTKLFNIIAATFLVVLTVVSLKAFAEAQPGNECQGNGSWENKGYDPSCPAGTSMFYCADGGTDCTAGVFQCGVSPF